MIRLPELLLEEEDLDESKASEEAKRLGLTYMSFGRYGKDGKVTHKSVGGKLSPISSTDKKENPRRKKAFARTDNQNEPERGVPSKNKVIVIKDKKNKEIGTITKMKTKDGEEFLSVRSTHPSVFFGDNTLEPGKEKEAAARLHNAVDNARRDLDMRIKEAKQTLKALLKQKKDFEKGN